MLNLLYIAISIPLIICFDITMQSYTIVFEIVSLSISACIIFINIRTPVIHRGGTTLSFKSVLIYYYHNGLVLDLVALWPMNLIFGISDLVEPVWLFPPIRIIRMIAAWKIMHIFGKFELFFKNYTVTMNILKAILFLCILWHWASCLWFFTSLYINSEQDFTWIEYNELDTSPLYKQVLFCYYTIMNVVSTVGYGDMFPMTDVERIFIILLINSGDALFAVAFGLIAGITLQASNNKSTDVFFKKMYSIKELITQNGGDQTHKLKVEQFFAYSWHLHKSTNMVSIKNLSTQLPYRLSKEVVYYSTKHLLEPMFGSFGSENLIRNVSTALEQCIYLPGDFIILKDDIGDEMYFIAEGRVYILAADKRTVINTLGQGSYFGEMAIFLESNIRTAFVQAETFCSILILKKTDLDNIKINYPSVAKDITKEAQKRASETREIMEANKEDMWQELEDIEEEKRDLERMYGTPLGMRVNSFSPSLFKEKSRRSSVDILRTPRNDESIAGSPLRVPRVKRRTSQFFKSINLQSNNKDEQEEQRNWASSNNVNSKVEDFKEKMKNEHKLLKVQDSLRMQKLNSFGTEKQSNLHEKVIHEDIENEDKMSRAASSNSSGEHVSPSPQINYPKSGYLDSEHTEKRRFDTDPMESSDNNMLMPMKSALNVEIPRGSFRFNQTMNGSGKISLPGKPALKRSITTKILKEHHKQKSPKIKRKISNILRSVDQERKMYSNVDKSFNGELPNEQKRDITDFRRKGVLRQRRLSRINLGKQLALSETSGLKLQWIVDYKNVNEEQNM